MATLQVKITDTADDGVELVGVVFFTDGFAAGVSDAYASLLYGFLRFLNVTVPQGAGISSATLTLNIIDITGTPDTTLYGVDADNAAAFADPGNLPSAASRTTASADPDPAGTGSHVITITSIVQEIVDRAGWASGNAMAFVAIDNTGSGSHFWVGEDYEDAGTAEATLDITYTVPAVGGAAPHHANRYGYGYNYR